MRIATKHVISNRNKLEHTSYYVYCSVSCIPVIILRGDKQLFCKIDFQVKVKKTYNENVDGPHWQVPDDLIFQ